MLSLQSSRLRIIAQAVSSFRATAKDVSPNTAKRWIFPPG
jgi:hypothetical protein